jgi:spermidine dehydrogenase
MRSGDHLGLYRPITRRDFLSGSAKALAGADVTSSWPGRYWAHAATGQPRDSYPPTRMGLRGTSGTSCNVLNGLRHGTSWSTAGVNDTAETYDLVVVGAGISGLAAAYFSENSPVTPRILVLDSEDDFGSHARRNEFHIAGHLQLMNAGTKGWWCSHRN